MNKLFNCDCLEKLKKMDSKSIDLVVIDPPYKMVCETGGGCFGSDNRKYHDELMNNKLTRGFDEEVLNELRRVMKKVNIYIWCNKEQILQYMTFFKDCNFDLLTWHKSNPVPTCSNKYLSDTEYLLFFREVGVKVYGTYETKKKWYVTPINKKDKELYNHPTVKPLSIIENLILNSSKEGDTVLDCFMGSGTTGVACKNLNRDFIGIEIDETYFKTASDRIEGLNDKNSIKDCLNNSPLFS